MRLSYLHQWPVHLKVSSEEASRTDRPREALHEIYDIAIALDTAGCVLGPADRLGISSIRLLGPGDSGRQPGETDLPSPSLYVSAGFPCQSLIVFDQTGRHVADVTLNLHSTVHIAGDVRHVISWPEELCAPMGMCIGSNRLFVCDSGHRRVRVYDAISYRPVPGEDSPGHFPGVHTRGVCQCSVSQQQQQRLVAGDFESGDLLVLDPQQRRIARLNCGGIGEPFALVPGPLPDSVFVSSSSMQGDHSVKLVSIAPVGENESRLLASCGGHGSGPGQFNKPRGLAFDPASGRLYVVDARNYRVQVFRVDSV